MNIQRSISKTISWTAFVQMIARDLIRLAARSEGLDDWLRAHGGSRQAPSRATRCYAYGLLGDTDEADILNAAMIIEIDRLVRATA
ncbi:MAG: hypothetical protein OXR84_02690 [Magnetovibrio sp.]|nr:hypothetical protein [Magnetovibrio sp.]